MTIILYNISDDDLKVTKNISNVVATFSDINLLNEDDINNPYFDITLNASYLSVNYAYIAAWHRYYFVDITILTGNIMRFTLRVDRLMSFINPNKSSLTGYVERNANNFNKDSKEMFSIDVDIPTITNIIDPVYQFYLNNSYFISKDKFYFIILTNLSNDTFINTWSGIIYKEKKQDSIKETNIVQANNENIKFTFMNAFGVESDLNEFNGGIISDIIYSPVE